MNLKKRVKGQASIFIIIALVFVVVIVLFFVYRPEISVISQQTPIEELEGCVNDAVNEGIDILSLQGGAIEPENYYLYSGNKVDYLCYTEENFEGCVVQKPLLKKSIENELVDYIKPRVSGCINSLRVSLEKESYDVFLESPEIRVELFPKNVVVTLDEINLKVTKERTETYDVIKSDVDSELYDFSIIASSIVNWESVYGDAEITSYMTHYPYMKVEKKIQGDWSKIYILTNTDTDDKFMFAVRSRAVPAGVVE